MARGFRHGGGGGNEPKKLKLFWGGLVEGVTWGFSGGATHSITNTLNISTSSSDYYVQGQYTSPQLDVTKYSTLHITVTTSSGGGDKRVGYAVNPDINVFNQSQTVGAANYTIDISNLSGFYYFKIYTNSGNRSGSNLKVSHVWLEK